MSRLPSVGNSHGKHGTITATPSRRLSYNNSNHTKQQQQLQNKRRTMQFAEMKSYQQQQQGQYYSPTSPRPIASKSSTMSNNPTANKPRSRSLMMNDPDYLEQQQSGSIPNSLAINYHDGYHPSSNAGGFGRGGEEQHSSPVYPGSPPQLMIGDRVAVDSMGIVGTLKFLGTTQFKEGIWAGIQLDILGTGKNDGSVNGIRYFSCPPQTGLFVSASKVALIENGYGDTESISTTTSSVRSSSPNAQHMNSSRAARYINMTAAQLSQQQQQQQVNLRRGKSNRTPSISTVGVAKSPSLQTPMTSPTSTTASVISTSRYYGNSTARNRSSQQYVQSPVPNENVHPKQQQQQRFNGGHDSNLPSPAMTPNSQQHSIIAAAQYQSQAAPPYGQVEEVYHHPHQPYHQHHQQAYYHPNQMELEMNEMEDPNLHMLTDTPIPSTMTSMTKSTTATTTNSAAENDKKEAASQQQPQSSSSTTTTSTSTETPHERLERILGEAIQQAPDELVMRLQQLQLRVEVLEAENKYLKLENTQNKTAEQILERSLVLRKKKKEQKAGDQNNNSNNDDTTADNDDDDEEELFTLQGHKAIVEEIKEAHVTEVKSLTDQQQELLSKIQRLETKVQELEAEQLQLMTERDRALYDMSTLRKEKSVADHRVYELESKLAEAEAATAAAQTGEKLWMEKHKALQERQLTSPTSPRQQQFFHSGSAENGSHDSINSTTDEQDDADSKNSAAAATAAAMDRQIKLEMEMEEVHEKMNLLREAARAKDMFLSTLTEQLEQHRNACEEKEREIRRIKADAERHGREKDRFLEEIKELEKKLLDDHSDCVSKDTYDKTKKDLIATREKLAEETKLAQEYRERIDSLQHTVDELKMAGIETLQLYENAVEMNRVDCEVLNASLQDERRKIARLEAERDDLRNAGLDTINAYESTLEEMNREKEAQIAEHNAKCESLQSTIDHLKQEISQLMLNVESGGGENKQTILVDVWESEKNRLQVEIETCKQEKAALAEALKQATEKGCKEHTKEEMDRYVKEKTKMLEEQLGRLQTDYDDQVNARSKYLDEVKTAVESQKKTEGELRRVSETKEKLERDIVELQAKLAEASSSTAQLNEGDVDEAASNAREITLHNEIERLKAQNAMLLKQKEQTEQQEDLLKVISSLKSDNKKLARDYSKLDEAHKQSQNECLKLMDEVEKLHQQMLSQEENDPVKAVLSQEGINENDKVSQLMQLHQQKIEAMMKDHQKELREMKEKAEAAEKDHEMKVKLLHRDISELENLIETKIFREADLDEALEKERKQVKKLQEELEDLQEEHKMKKELSAFSTASSEKRQISNESVSAAGQSVYCEICEEYGHDLISCKAVSVPETQ